MKKSISTPNFNCSIKSLKPNSMKKSVSTNVFNADVIVTTLQNMSIAGSSIDDTICILTKNIVDNKNVYTESPIE